MRDEPIIYPDTKPDRLGVIVRGVCGAVLGAGVGVFMWLRIGGLDTRMSLALFVVTVAGCTWGTIRHGDEFWLSLFKRR